ncbi:SMAD/FHA domain-containing protein [Rhynchospora pubera]|uniref:SMAD/FHA domain-containing protein n=1 Tax=Rhynchospora pubera TaxID=906938 RepID=A0AAV8CI53_9POAL|nr:SMAD/FHA domain-containing protein [Rhynchospora pubera]
MKVPMGPPPLPNPNPNPSSSSNSESEPPPPPPPSHDPLPEEPSSSDQPGAPLPDSDKEKPENPDSIPIPSAQPDVAGSKSHNARSQVPYTIPEWSEAPDQSFFFEVLKDGSIIEKLDVSKKGAYMFGRTELCDFMLEHPTISRFHAVLQFKGGSEVFLFDLGSTHGTFINKNQVKKKEYTEIHVGDVIRFGLSTRLYIFQGPSDLMPPEGDLNKIREAKAAREEMRDREESLSRARREASLAEGISWGMAEDAIEETTEVDADEITWQTYKGQLTERQEKTKSKIVKRIEKVAHMKKEIDAIRAKDINQGGLTQGQQTQIARNELRITQLMEELDNLEETLNESIRESVGARTGKGAHDKKKGAFEGEDDDAMSDEDDFYDRTKKNKKKLSSGEQQSVETADSLLDKKDSIDIEIELKRKSLEEEKNQLASSGGSKNEDGDDLDAYMTGLSSQLVHEKVVQAEKELADLQAELEKVIYLLRIADPMGDAAKKRELAKASQPLPSVKDPHKHTDPNPFREPMKPASTTQFKEPKIPNVTPVKGPKEPSDILIQESASPPKEREHEEKEKSASRFTVPKPQWLGAARVSRETRVDEVQLESIETEENDGFVDYKDRKTTLLTQSANVTEIEAAKPGLIMRKRKEPASSEDTGSNNNNTKTPAEAESSVADVVALLLKHERGYQAMDEPEDGDKKVKRSKKEKRVLGPSRPDFLESSDYETWVPPEGQTGDGRTKLNERFGY